MMPPGNESGTAHTETSDLIHHSSRTRYSNSSSSSTHLDANTAHRLIQVYENSRKNSNNYSSMDSSGAASTPLDYETLLTLALENTSKRAELESKRKQNLLFVIIVMIFLISIALLSTVSFSEYPQEQELHSEINDLKNDVDELNSEVSAYQKDEDVTLIERDIQVKKDFINRLERDESIDPSQKAELIKELSSDIEDLKIAEEDLQKDDQQKDDQQKNNQQKNNQEGQGLPGLDPVLNPGPLGGIRR